MATPPKYIRFPFAATGDKEAIPDEAQASGLLSYSEGFGLDYERDPAKDAKAKRMPRGGTNQVLYDATSNIQQYQLYGVPYWYGAASNGGTAIQYQKNAMVRFASGSNENIYISLKDNNTDAPSVSASWFLFQPYNATLLSRLSVAPFVAVESMVLTTPPTNPTQGKAYLIPSNATGLWSGKGGQLTEWDGASWSFTVTPNGHSIGLPDGRIFTCINNQYSENIALDSQSGKWSYATASVDGSTYIAQVTPAPTAIPAGFAIRVKMPAINSGPILLGVNQFPPRPVYYRDTNEALVGNDWLPGVVVEFIFDGGNWRFNTSFSYINRKISLDSQSGKWNYAEAGGTANALTTTLDPKPLALTAGIGLQLKIKTNNTGAATLNLNNLGVKPIIYHETGEPLVGGDFQIGDVINLVFDGTSWRLQPSLAYMDKRYSRLVPPPTDTFYVNATTGNDSNNGFSATTAFKSLQGAVDAINSRYMTVGKITVRVAAGTYQGFVLTNSYVTDWDFVGDANSPNNVKIDASTVSSTRRGILLANVKVTINGFSILSYWDGINVNTNSDVIVRNCTFQGFNSSVAYGLSTFGGRLRVFGTISFSGTFVSAFFNSGGSLTVGYSDGVTIENVRITYVSGIVCASANLISENGGLTALTPSTITFVGNPATPKFIAAVNGFIRAYGAGINFLPGTQAGIIATGGQYV